MTPLSRRHPYFTVKHHGKIVTVFKPALHGDVDDQHFRVLQQILRMANTQLAQILTNGHARLTTKLLAERTRAALLLYAKIVKDKRTIQAARQRSNQLIKQRLPRHCQKVIHRVSMPFQGDHQLRQQKFSHVISLVIMVSAFMLQLRNHLPRLVHAAAA